MSPDTDDGNFPPLGIVRRLIRETGLALIVLGLIVLLFVAYQLLGTNLTEQHNQHRLKQSFEQELAAPPTTVANPVASPTSGKGGGDNPTVGGSTTASVDSAIPAGTAIDHLVIPAIGVDKYVVQGTSEDDLSQGPGHYPETVLPGQTGNAAIAGHRTTYGAPFFRLDNLKQGNPIYITDTSGTRFTYQVTSKKVVSPSDVSVLDPTTTAQLTLTTCNPRFSASSRLIVVAKLLTDETKLGPGVTTTTVPGATTTTTKPGPTTTTVPGATTTTLPGASTTTVPPATTSTTVARQQAITTANLGEGDHSARGPAILYGALVVILWIGTRLAIHHTRRWRRGLAYVVGIAVCLIPLWFCFENVVRLLPPNI